MEDLYSLLHSLTSSEWRSFEKYLTVFTAHDISKLKFLQLAKILMNAAECPKEDSCCIAVCGAKKQHSFTELKSALKEKVLDFLLTDISADKQHELDAADYNIIKIKKKSAQFQQLFYSKKRIPLVYDMLDDIINSAREYEQYSILVEHLRIKKTIVGSKNKKEEFEKINLEMEYYWDCNRMVNKAEHYYNELKMLFEYSGNIEKQKLFSFFEKANAELEGYYEKIKSAVIKYHYKFLQLGFYEHYKNYSQARSVCLELLDVVRNNKSVYRRQRVGVVYDNLSRCEFYLNHFKSAAEYAQLAQKHFNLNSENYCIALEQEFYALFAMKQYDKAIETAHKMIGSAARKELGEFRFSKYNYLLANALFKERKFNDALQLLTQKRELSKDKAGWELGARMLKIMTLIEMLKLDDASLAVRSLKEFCKYTDKTTPVSERDKKILNLLLIAERAGFLFSTLNGNTDKYMNALTPSLKGEDNDNGSLQGGGQHLRWEPFTHEVIPFHEWFAGKMKKHIPKLYPSKEKKVLVPVRK